MSLTSQAGITKLGIQWNTRYSGTMHYDSGSASIAPNTVISPFLATRQNVTGSDPLPAGYGESFTTFCLDLGYNIATPGWWKSGDFPASNASNGKPIWETDGIYKAAYLFNTFIGSVSALNDPDGAALQLAIWEVLYEKPSTTYTLAGGQFWAGGFNGNALTDGIAPLANTMLAGVNANYKDANGKPKFASTYWDTVKDASGTPLNGSQALVGPPSAIPEPAEIVLLLAALGGIAFGLKRLRSDGDALGAVRSAEGRDVDFLISSSMNGEDSRPS